MSETNDDVSEQYKVGMRRLASSVCLITGGREGERGGLIATAVNSVCADPPTLLICVNRSASAHDMIAETGSFCVNVLPHDSQDLAGQFSSSSRRDERFSLGEWSSLATGAPALMDALVTFDCTVAEVISYHSHTIFLGRVEAVNLPERAIHPLIYMEREYRQVAA